MAKCLRCGAGSEWLQGDVKPDREVNAALLEALEEVADNVALDRSTSQIVRAAIRAAKGETAS